MTKPFGIPLGQEIIDSFCLPAASWTLNSVKTSCRQRVSRAFGELSDHTLSVLSRLNN
jgi:hypothetical protein